MVNVSLVPVQTEPIGPKLGVTVTVAFTGELVILEATNELIFPFPLAPKLIEVVLLFQVYVEFTTVPVKFITPLFSL